MSKSRLGKSRGPMSEKQKLLLSVILKGNHPNPHKGMTYEEMYGTEKAAILRNQRKEQAKLKRLEDPICCCIYCKKSLKGMGNLYRWHGDNCKMKSRII